MVELRKPGDRIHTPTALGVPIPPSRKLTSPGIAPASLPPEDRELVLARLREVSDNFASFRDELNAERGRDLAWRANLEDRLVQHDDRLAQHEEDLRAIREAILDWREMKADIREISKRLHEDARDDVLTARELGQLKVEVARSASASGAAAGVEAGHDAGKRAARPSLIAALVACVVAVLPLVPDIIKGLIKLLNQ